MIASSVFKEQNNDAKLLDQHFICRPRSTSVPLCSLMHPVLSTAPVQSWRTSTSVPAAFTFKASYHYSLPLFFCPLCLCSLSLSLCFFSQIFPPSMQSLSRASSQSDVGVLWSESLKFSPIEKWISNQERRKRRGNLAGSRKRITMRRQTIVRSTINRQLGKVYTGDLHSKHKRRRCQE